MMLNEVRTIGDLVGRARIQRDSLAEYQQEHGHFPLNIEGLSFQVYDGQPLQFNVTLSGHIYATIKFEEREAGRRFAVAVAPKDGESINHTKAKVFTLSDPLEKLLEVFPDSSIIQQFFQYITKGM